MVTIYCSSLFFFPDSSLLTYDHSSYSLQGFHCDICTEILEQLVQLECDHLMCLHCSCIWLEVSHAKPCPCSSYSDLQPNHIRTPPAAIISFLGSLLVNCNRSCRRTVQARQYKVHIGSQGQHYFIQSTHSPSETTAAAILQKDAAPVTATERKVSFLKQIMMETDGNVIKVPTQGQVLFF